LWLGEIFFRVWGREDSSYYVYTFYVHVHLGWILSKSLVAVTRFDPIPWNHHQTASELAHIARASLGKGEKVWGIFW
jgi:hypothetical protein